MIDKSKMTRADFVQLINERDYKTVIEVGVGYGGYSQWLVSQCPNIVLYAVDPFEVPAEAGFKPGGFESTLKRLDPWLRTGFDPRGIRAYICPVSSVEAAKAVEDKTVDFIYIDGDHSYEAVKADLEAWLPKMRPGGFLSGHDYFASRQPHVVRAVDEFRLNHSWLEFGITVIDPTQPGDAHGEEFDAPSWWFEIPK